MEDISRQFQQSSIEFLKKTVDELKTQETVSKQSLQEIFRRVHTIKGSAQAFGMPNTSELAHDLENILELLHVDKESQKERIALLDEGFRFLILSLEYPDFSIPESFLKKIRKDVPLKPQRLVSNIFLTLIPPEVFDQLTEYEKGKLQEITKLDVNIIGTEAIFEVETVSGELEKLQKILAEYGEIAFTLPSEKELKDNEIGFHIISSSEIDVAVIKDAIRDFNAEAKVLTAQAEYTNNLSGVLSKIVSQGKIWANALGKTVNFKVLADEPELDADYLGLIFEILMHLVRNAVDHSFDKAGNIEILLKEIEEGIELSVSDDGKGIDLFVIRAKAVEQKLILPETNLSERETLDLIFIPGFSTAAEVTELSGRGVGLDTVQNLVVGSKGTIQVETRNDKGTTFEIFLPLD